MLTNAECKAAKPKKTKYKLSDANGLHLLVMPNGSKYWHYKYRIAGKEKILSLGVYDRISLVEAREAHRKAYRMVLDGIDPSQYKIEKKIQRKVQANNTFEAIANEWLEKRASLVKPTTLRDTKNRLEKELFPKIGKMPITSITSVILYDALSTIEKRGIFETTKRVRTYASHIFDYAISTCRVESNPAERLMKSFRPHKVQHRKALPLELLPEYLKKLDSNEANLHKQTIFGLKLILLCLVRRNEICNAEWKEISFEDKLWIIPAHKMKMGREHLVPLSDQALEIFKKLKDLNGSWPHVLAGIYRPRQPMSADTLLTAMYRMGYKGIADIHGFRAFCLTTIREQLKYPYEIPDMQLAHYRGDGVKRAYDRSQFIDERTQMMQDWADYLDKARGHK